MSCAAECFPVTVFSQGSSTCTTCSQTSTTHFTHAFHKGCHDWVKQCSARMRKELVLPHCTNLYHHLANDIISWESRYFSGQEFQCGGSHGLRLTTMPGRFITSHFCGSIAEQEGREKTVCLSWSTYKRPSKPDESRLGYRLECLPCQVSITWGPDQKQDQTT